MSFDLLLKPSCSGCGSSTDLYGSNCKHMTLCLTCGKTMAENKGKCYDCGATVTRLIREYNVRASASSDKNYFIGRFMSGLPNFSRKRNAENKWSLYKEGLQGRQLSDALREKYKNRPWLLEDETGQFQFQGHLEGSQSATYYLLVLQGKEFTAIPAGSWYNFNKVAQYKQLTLEEAEEKMKNRKKTADGYERWMMKAASNGPAAFGEVEKFDDKDAVGASGRGRRKTTGDENEGNASDRRLSGPPNSALTCYIRFALLYKSVKLSFVPSETPHFGSDAPVIRIGSESVSGSRERLLRFIDSRFPHPPLVLPSRRDDGDQTTPLVAVSVAALQHKSVLWHVERLLRWAKDLAARGGRTAVDPAVGTPRMELRKFGRSYSQLLEVMLEHAQMEEKVLFPILEMADRGLCKASNEEHARDLPIMNGIKEDIKSTVVLDLGSFVCQEALSNLSKRLKLLQEHCKHHFMDEEKKLLPLLEAVELTKEQQENMLEQLLDVMKQTHSHLLNFFLEGLLPQEALQYLDLVTSSCDKNRASFGLMLQMTVA